MKLLHWSKQLHLDWAKVLPEGWKFLNWPAVIPVHRETFHKLTVGFCRLLVAKCSRNLLLNLVNRYFLMMCWLNFVMGCYDFLVFICLNKKNVFTDCQSAGHAFEMTSLAVRLDLHSPICTFWDPRASLWADWVKWWDIQCDGKRKADWSPQKSQTWTENVRTVSFGPCPLVICKA